MRSIKSENFGGKAIAKTLATKDRGDMAANRDLAEALMKDVDVAAVSLGWSDEPFNALAGHCKPDAMVEFLKKYRWSKLGVMQRQINFLKGQLGDLELIAGL